MKRPGLRARYRQGYFALSQPQLDQEQAEDLMRAAAWNPLDATGLGLTVTATPFESSGGRWLRLEVRLDPRGIVLEKEAGRSKGGIDFLYIQKRQDNTVLASPVRRLPISVTAEQQEKAAALKPASGAPAAPSGAGDTIRAKLKRVRDGIERMQREGRDVSRVRALWSEFQKHAEQREHPLAMNALNEALQLVEAPDNSKR